MAAALHEVRTGGPASSRRPGRALHLLVTGAVIGFFLLPIAIGLAQTALLSLGHFPAIGASGISAKAWIALFRVPGLLRAVSLSLTTGLAATLLSLVLAFAAVAALHGRVPPRLIARLALPVLAAPHAAMAIGLAFVLAPSGWIARGLAALLDWPRPPDVATVGDPWGLALIVGLTVKEAPFLTLMLLAALTQLPARRQMASARALGYPRAEVWLKVLLPQIWRLIRLPVLVTLAYGLSVVDMAMILGPSNPPVLSVLVTRMMNDPDLAMLLPASAGGVLQLALVGVSFALLALLVRGLRLAGLIWLRRGGRGRASGRVTTGLAALAGAMLLLGGLGLMALLIWSLVWTWRWPDLLPSAWSLRIWQANLPGWSMTALNSLLIGLASTLLSLVLAIAWLESGDRRGRRGMGWMTAAIYVPLLLPQLSFLMGLNILLLRLTIPGGIGAVIFAHCLFVFPYVLIALSDPWRAVDPRLTKTAAALGAGQWRRLIRIKLPVLMAPLGVAAAIGFAVSVAQYLPTLFLGAGRVATLTTEAVSLSASSDRRVVGVYAVLQAALPWLGYALAVALPAILHRNRRDLRGGAAL